MKGLFIVVCAAFVVYVYSQGVEVQCPENTDGNLTLVAHPCNCSSYYVCFAELEMSMPCPENLHFNPRLQTCDWPWRAKCRTSPACPKSSSIQNPSEEEITV